jgi:endoglucanase
METHSPSGFEQEAQKVIRREMQKYADEVRTDVHGNVIGIKNPQAKFKVMLAGHCDEIGLMVTLIDERGFLYFQAIGGVDAALTQGQRVVLHGEKGPVVGVIGRRPIHLLEQEERGKPTKMEKQWIDIGAKNKKDADKVVAVGDVVTVDAHFVQMRNRLAVSRGFDDKCGSFVVAEALRLVSAMKLPIGVYAVSTVQEELGLRGAKTSAHGIAPDAGIAVDVGFASDLPSAEKAVLDKIVGDIALGRGPILHRGANINPILGRLLETTAKKRKIPYQMQAEPRASGTDANVIQITRAGVAAALVSIPNRYMHTPVEVVSLDDLDNAARLIAATLSEMKPGMSFIP